MTLYDAVHGCETSHFLSAGNQQKSTEHQSLMAESEGVDTIGTDSSFAFSSGAAAKKQT